MSRQGRFISVQVDHGERFEEVKSMALARIPQVTTEQSATLSAIDEHLASVHIAEIVARACIKQGFIDPDTLRETTSDHPIPRLEYLALRALRRLSTTSTDAFAPPDLNTLEGSEGFDEAAWSDRVGVSIRIGVAADGLFDLATDAFRQTEELITLEGLQASWDPTSNVRAEEYRTSARIDALRIRGTAYSVHRRRVLLGCFEASKQRTIDLLGFTAEQAWNLAEATQLLVSSQVSPRLEAISDRFPLMCRELTLRRKKKLLGPDIARLTPTQQKRALLSQIEAEILVDSVRLMSVTAEDLSSATSIPVDAVNAFLEALTCDPADYDQRWHRAPAGTHPITRTPFIRMGNAYFIATPDSLEEALRPRMEELLKKSDQKAWDRYETQRARWTEREAAQRLADALPGSRHWTGVPWTGPTDSSDLDGLVTTDDFAIRIQVKAGKVSEPARRGAPSMVEDVDMLIGAAAEQHARLSAALAAASADQLGFTPEQQEALSRPLRIDAIVCLEDMTVWSTHTHKLRDYVALPKDEPIPWVLSLTDLMATTDVLSGAQLIHYLTRRLRLENEGKIEAHDELDWLGHYIHDGLYFDPIFEQESPPDVLRLLSYTVQFDDWYLGASGYKRSTVPRPERHVTPGVQNLVNRLQTERPRHWSTAAILALDGDTCTQEVLDDALEQTSRGAFERGWSSRTLLHDAYALTVLCSSTAGRRELRELLDGRIEKVRAEHDAVNIVAIGVGPSGMAISVNERDPEQTIARRLLARLNLDSESTAGAQDAPDQV